MSNHDNFWLNAAKAEDYADLSISTDKQVAYLVDALQPVVRAKKVPFITEFGCGYGRLTRRIQRKFPKALITGIDINPDIIAQAKEQDQNAIYGVKADLKGSPKQDAIYCVQVLQHMPKERKRQFIEEAAEALNYGGVLVFQYVEGDSDTFLTHDARFVDVSTWLQDAGLEIASYEQNLIQDRWTWVTAVKGM